MPFVKIAIVKRRFSIVGNHIELSKDYINTSWHLFSKLTGSKFADVIGQSEYSTPVKIWATIVKIFKEPMDKIYKAGNVIEPSIRSLAENKIGCKYLSYNADQENYDVFRDIDPILGGIPDGEPVNAKGEVDYSTGLPMLEIKTASIDKFKRTKNEKGAWQVSLDANNVPVVSEEGKNKAKWFKDNNIVIPQNYIDQLSLYLYLRNATQGIFAVCFLKPEDYANPDKVDLSKREIHYKEFTLDRPAFEKQVKKATEWYKKYVITGVSPEFTEKDIKWLKEEGML